MTIFLPVSDLYPSRAEAAAAPDPEQRQGDFSVVGIRIPPNAKLPPAGTYYGKVPATGGSGLEFWWPYVIAKHLGVTLDPPSAGTSLVSDRLYPSRAEAEHSPDPTSGRDRGFTVVEIQIPEGARLPSPGTYYGKVPVKGGTWWACLIANALGASSVWKGDKIMPRSPVVFKDEQMKTSPNSILDRMTGLLLQFHQIILYGPPGTGKTLHAQRVALALLGDGAAGATATAGHPTPAARPTGGLTPAEVARLEELQGQGRLDLVVFHPAYEYEQFVIGISPGVAGNGGQGLAYKVEPGIFWQMCKQAEKGRAVLIIDEINRGNLPKLLGELVYALEYRERPVRLPVEYNGSRDLKVSKNLYVIGTMNSSDRSIGHIDVAVRRRFGLFHVEPDPEAVRSFWQRRDPALGAQLIGLMERLNKALGDKDPGGELRVGHAYFLADPGLDDKAELPRQVARKWEHQVYQLLREYDQLMNLGTGFFKAFPPDFDKALQGP